MSRAVRSGLGAALALPVVLATGLVIYFAVPPSATFVRGAEFETLVVTDRNGVVLREVRSSSHGVAHWVELEDVSPWLRRAAVAAEDKRFYRHPGLDPVALGRALMLNIRARGIRSGGSTITQQLVRNLYQAQDRNPMVKLAEAMEALRLELHHTKDEILEAYLNRVGFGNQVYGVDAASRLYFDRECDRLSLAQSAFLAAIPRAPSACEPYRHYRVALKRQRVVLRRMLRTGAIGDAEYRAALAETVAVTLPRRGFEAPHFVDMVLAKESGDDLKRIRTTLDLGVQQTCERLLDTQLGRLRGNRATNGAVVVLDRVSGDVLAMVGSSDYFSADAGQVNACLSLRQPGSTVKPFVYAAAFECGLAPASILPDIPHYFVEQGGDYRPQNYDKEFHGPVSARTALGSSYNVPAVVATERIGPELLLAKLRQSGLQSLDKDAGYYGHALGLGVGDVRLVELVNAYRMLANAGRCTRYRVVTSRTDLRGNLRHEKDTGGGQVFGPGAVSLVTDILMDNGARSPAFGEFSCLNLPFECAAKTGTSKDFRDNWTVGYTTEYVVGVWIGNFDGSPMSRVSGVTGAGPLFRDITLAVHEQAPGRFTEPEDVMRVQVCPGSGQLPGPHCPGRVTEIFLASGMPRDTCDFHVLCRIDRNTGGLAGDATRPEDMVEQVLEAHDPMYWPWLADNGLPLPPVAVPTAERAQLAVLYPDCGDVFKVDPDLALEHQAIRFRARVPEDMDQAVWELDGKEVGSVTRPFTLLWPLEPGRHRVCVHTRRRRSEEVSFLVLP